MLKEERNLDTTQSKKSVSIKERNSKLYVKELYRNDRYAVVVRGKVDGISQMIRLSKRKIACTNYFINCAIMRGFNWRRICFWRA